MQENLFYRMLLFTDYVLKFICIFQQPDPRPSKKRAALTDVKDEASIEELTIKQLKEILAHNFVDYKGCCEKYELVERVKRLWSDMHKNLQRGRKV